MQVRKKLMRIAAAILAVTVLCGSCERKPDAEKDEEPSAPPPSEPISADIDTDVSSASVIIHDERTEIRNTSGELACLISYEMPVIKYQEGMEKRQAAADRINDYFEQEKESFLSSPYIDRLIDRADECVLMDWMSSAFFSAIVLTDVVYFQDNILSIRQLEHWMGGGTNQDYEHGLTFNLETGEKMLVSDFISLPLEDFASKSINYFYIHDRESHFSEEELKEYYVFSSYEEYSFFVEEDMLYLLFSTEDGDTIVVWSIEKQEPVQLIYGRYAQFDSDGTCHVEQYKPRYMSVS